MMSAHKYTTTDNNGTTNVGKHYVFTMQDGSGVSLSHLTYDTVAPTLYTTAGTGTNALTTAPTQYYNTWPNLYEKNYCGTSNLLLEGTTGYADDAYTDGYKATITLSLEMVLAGNQSRWRGVCIIMYRTQYI